MPTGRGTIAETLGQLFGVRAARRTFTRRILEDQRQTSEPSWGREVAGNPRDPAERPLGRRDLGGGARGARCRSCPIDRSPGDIPKDKE
jgi:hypothetical protein